MNKIKNIWFNIRHFKFNSIFLRTFLFITALTVIPFIVLSIMFYDVCSIVVKIPSWKMALSIRM